MLLKCKVAILSNVSLELLRVKVKKFYMALLRTTALNHDTSMGGFITCNGFRVLFNNLVVREKRLQLKNHQKDTFPGI